MSILRDEADADPALPLETLFRRGAAAKCADGLLVHSPKTGTLVLVCALTDLDGTANDEHVAERDRLATILPAKEAFATLARSGIVTGICTARSTGEARHYQGYLGTTGPVISENGAVISLADGSQRILGDLAKLKATIREITHALGRPIPNSLDAAGLEAAWEKERRGESPPFLGHADRESLRRAADRRASCFLVGLSPREKEAVAELAGRRGLTCFGDLLHLVPKGVDKGRAFAALNDDLLHRSAQPGWQPSVVSQIVFGNGENDLPLFEQALATGGWAVLVGDATKPQGFHFDIGKQRVPKGTITLPGVSHGQAILQSLPTLRVFFARQYGILFPW